MKVQRYSFATVTVLGFAAIAWGVFHKPHQHWLLDCGALIIIMNLGAVLLTLRSQMRDFARTMLRLQRLCDFTGVPFGLANAVYRWLWPFIFSALLLSIAFLVAAIILKTNGLLDVLYVIFDILALLGVVLVLTRPRSAESILRKLESVVHSGKLPTSPPTAAKFILLLIPKRHREHLMGDLEEEYTTILVPEYGARRARIWYWWQVVISVGPLLWVHIKRGAAIAWLWKRVR